MTQTDRLNVGLVGLGGVAQEHLKGYVKSDVICLRAGADLNAERCAHAESNYGIKTYGDADALLSSEELDIVCVLTPPAAHLPVVEMAASRGIHVLCEKPLAPSVEVAEEIAAIVRKTGVQFQFGASYRHLPAMQRAKEIISAGQLGVIRLCNELAIGGSGAANAKALPESHYPKGGPGGTPMGLVDHGVHMIDAFPWLTDSRVKSVWGRGNVSGDTPQPEVAVMMMENGASINLIYDEGTFGLSLPGEGAFMEGAGWNVQGYVPAGGFDPFPTTLEVYGSTGALRMYPYANRLYLSNADGVREVKLPLLPSPNHFRAQIDSFAQSITAGTPLAASIDDGVSSTRVLSALYQSAERQTEICL